MVDWCSTAIHLSEAVRRWEGSAEEPSADDEMAGEAEGAQRQGCTGEAAQRSGCISTSPASAILAS